MSIPFIEENDQTSARHEHLEALRSLVGNVYPNKFERTDTITGFAITITSNYRTSPCASPAASPRRLA